MIQNQFTWEGSNIMRSSLEKLCETFITNRDTIKNTFKWDNQYIIPVCASDLSGKHITADGTN